MSKIYIAFDGVLVSNSYPFIGTPNTGAVEWIKKLQGKGAEFVLCANRQDKQLQEALHYLELKELELDTELAKEVCWIVAPPKSFIVDASCIDMPMKFCSTALSDVVDWEKLGPIIERQICEIK